MMIDNAASRLVSILTQSLNTPPETQCRRAWEKILSCEASNNSQLFLLLGKAMLLPSEVADLVSLHFPHQAASIPLWKDPIDTAFLNHNLQSNWQTFRQHLNPYCIPQLSLVADLLHTKIGSSIVPPEELVDLRNKFTTLLEEIMSANLPDSLKLYLSTEISKLLQLIREYSISGTDPILRQADAMFGHVVRNTEYRSFLTNNDLGQRLLDNLSAMANILTVATGLPQLTVAISGFLS